MPPWSGSGKRPRWLGANTLAGNRPARRPGPAFIGASADDQPRRDPSPYDPIRRVGHPFDTLRCRSGPSNGPLHDPGSAPMPSARCAPYLGASVGAGAPNLNAGACGPQAKVFVSGGYLWEQRSGQARLPCRGEVNALPQWWPGGPEPLRNMLFAFERPTGQSFLEACRRHVDLLLLP